MVSGFRRSATMPKPTQALADKPYHVRSASLPTRSHPLLSQLKDQIQTLWSWVSDQSCPSSARDCDGFKRLRAVQDAVDDLLQLPQSQEALRRQPELLEELLDCFLRLADAVGILRSGLMGLSESVRSAQVGTRTSQPDPIRSYARSLKKLAKELSPAAAMVRDSEKRARPTVISATEEENIEVVNAFRETCSVASAVAQVVLMSVSWSNSSNWMGLTKKKNVEVMMLRELEDVAKLGQSEEKTMALGRLQVAAECLERIETETEKVYRSLICTRVSLLNIITTR